MDDNILADIYVQYRYCPLKCRSKFRPKKPGKIGLFSNELMPEICGFSFRFFSLIGDTPERRP